MTQTILRLNQDQIIAYARAYDAQYFHVDEEAAKASHFGGLIASGWQSVTYAFRHLSEARLLPRGMRLIGMEDLKWIRPVRPDHLYYLTARRLSEAQDKSARFAIIMTDEGGDEVMTLALIGEESCGEEV